MRNLNCFGITVILAALALPATANAESWICEHGNLVREISVERETASPVPCAVKYDKKSEGLGTSVLWTANTDAAYCDAKANGLAEKLQGLGWSCTAY
jgi:hypothetical protein